MKKSHWVGLALLLVFVCAYGSLVAIPRYALDTEWARQKTPELPLFAMGISMGGATVIHAASKDADLDGVILLDSVLDTSDAFRQGAWVNTGLPPALFAPSAWSAATFYGLPGGTQETLEQIMRFINVRITEGKNR